MSSFPVNGVVRTTCSYCSVGCNVDVQIEEGKAVKLAGTKDYPVNLGKTCTKGFNLLKPYEAADRALYPMLRDADGVLQRVSWDRAAATFTDRIKAVQQKYGKESVAFLSTGQMVIEEMALLGAFAKFGMGIKHGDGNTRQCMASAATAYKQSFGFDAPPFTYQDAEESDLLIFVGSNPVIAHPILWQRVKMNKRSPVIVAIDPRKTETGEEATIHLGIEPKSDLYLLYAIARLLIKSGRIRLGYIEAHTTGWQEFAAHVETFTVELACEKTGLKPEQITGLADLVATRERVSFWWTMGVNQSHQGVRTIQAMIALCLMTGNIGRPGTGPNSITGQTNAMGSRLFSNTTSLLAGHDFTKSQDRTKVAGILGIDESLIPSDAGLAYDQILEAIDDGRIKALWIICTNPAHSWIDKHVFYERMKKLEFLVVQDIYGTTETARLADLFLPAGGSVEKNGTLINSERRMGIVQKVAEPPGEARADFDIFRTLLEAWGCGSMFERWKTPAAVFDILRELSRGQPCDFTGITDWTMLLSHGGIQWPWTSAMAATGQVPGQRRLFEDGKFHHADGKAKFLQTDVREPGEIPDVDYPFWLLTGRGTMHQWHTQTRTGKVENIRKMYPADCYVEINPIDAKRLHIEVGNKVFIEGRRGAVVVMAAIKSTVTPGKLFMPMHYPETNWLTFPSFDEHSRQPSYKIGAVRLWRCSDDLKLGALSLPHPDRR